MSNLNLFFALLILLPTSFTEDAPHQANNQYSNGQWLDGDKFVSKTMYSVNGVFTETKPDKIDLNIDLKNNYVIPPFCETHTHLLEGIGDYERVINNYLRDGVFYVKNPNNIQPLTANIRPKLNDVHGLDAVFANGGITCSGGHPETLYEDRLRDHLAQVLNNPPRGWFKNKSYFTVDSEKDFVDTWPLIKEGKPDFIKVYLANTDDIGKPSPAKFALRKGLDPKLVPLIVRTAHHEGFRVSAHVETRLDFRYALEAGVDEITHTPGFYLFSDQQLERYRLTEDDAKLAAEKKVFVVTALLSRNLTEDQALMPHVEKMQAYNLSLLHKQGVQIAIGSDHARSPLEEVAALRKLNVFDNATILRMWGEVSPRTIFPNRKLGLFKDGYEASFLALEANPLENLDNISKISLRYKKGHAIELK